MVELALSPNRVGWAVAIGWFLVLVSVGQAARYLRWLEDRGRPRSHAAPVPGVTPVEPPGRLALTLAALIPLTVAPMMMLRPPGEVSVWLGGASLMWAGLWIGVGMTRIVLDDRKVIDLTIVPEVLDLRTDEPSDTADGRVGAR